MPDPKVLFGRCLIVGKDCCIAPE